ncbi:MAG: circularly permuted type 2 ATP-grasp protein [Chromatiaceae bacterium]
MLRQIQSTGAGQLQALPGIQDPAMAYHEFYQDDFRPRDHYLPMWEHIQTAGQQMLGAKARDAHLTLHTQGVTFTVYSNQDDGIERVWPFDILPRIITAAEWELLEAGLKQRIRAMNLFLKDLYHGQRILKDGVVPPELIYRGKDFRREIMDIDPPHDIYTHISGVDLIRDEEGRYLVLEDNLRTPSGVSYMIENRIVERRVLPEFFARYRVRRVEHYPDLLLQALRFLSPRGADEATIVVLTPGIYNSAYFEHTFLAKEMGVELAEGRDLVCANDKVYLKTTRGLRRVDVIYRRVDDDFLDPLVFRSDSVLGIAGVIDAWRAGNVALANAPGSGIADDKAVYAYAPEIIRYYLGESPILQNVPTYQMTDHQDRAYVLDNMAKMVVKAVAESGGYGMLMGPSSTPAQRSEFAKKIEENPRNYIAQPVVQLSRHICYLDGELESRHLDLRPFVIYGDGIQVVPGGLTRVAMTKGSLVVNSSQGGGSKDTWVLAD